MENVWPIPIVCQASAGRRLSNARKKPQSKRNSARSSFNPHLFFIWSTFILRRLIVGSLSLSRSNFKAKTHKRTAISLPQRLFWRFNVFFFFSCAAKFSPQVRRATRRTIKKEEKKIQHEVLSDNSEFSFIVYWNEAKNNGAMKEFERLINEANGKAITTHVNLRAIMKISSNLACANDSDLWALLETYRKERNWFLMNVIAGIRTPQHDTQLIIKSRLRCAPSIIGSS